jgi:hypothetical protein
LKNRGVWIVVLFGAAFAAIMYTSTRGLSQFRVEVCMEYEGRSACRTASAATEEKARETATVNACALIASGMSDSIKCQNTAPKSVNWLEGKPR